MKELTIAQIIDKNRIASDRVWLFAVKIHLENLQGTPTGTTVRLVRNAEDVTINGEVYTAIPFDVSASSSGTAPSRLQLTIQDQNRLLQSILGQYLGLVGFDVDLIVADFDSGSTVATSYLSETYEVINSGTSDYVMSLELGADNPLNILVPKRTQWKDRCSFRYKSTECGYSGEMPSCDFSLDGVNGCVAHSNTQRYGGFPGLVIRGN